MRAIVRSRLRLSAAVTTMTVLALATVTVPPSDAHACSCAYYGHWGFLGPAQGRLPANAAGVPWFRPHVPYVEEGLPANKLEHRFTAEILDGSEYRQLPVSVRRTDGFSDDYAGVYVVAPKDEQLQPGATYRFSVDQAGEGRQQVIVTVDHETLTEEAAFSLDASSVTVEPVTVAMGGFCAGRVEAALVHIEGRLSQDAARWREQLLYRTIVDDAIFWRARSSMCSTDVPGRTESAVGHDRVYATCDPSAIDFMDIDGALKPGHHTLKMEAYLPGTGIVLETADKSVNLPCWRS